VAQVLQSAGARVLAVGHHAEKLSILAKRDIETRLASDWDGARRPLVVEATGSAEGFERALAATLPRGTVVLKSTVAAGGEVDLSPLVIDEIRVVGSRCGPFPAALHALEAGQVDVAPLISDRFALADGVAGLDRAAERGVLKVLLESA